MKGSIVWVWVFGFSDGFGYARLRSCAGASHRATPFAGQLRCALPLHRQSRGVLRTAPVLVRFTLAVSLYTLISIVHLIAALFSSLWGRERTFVETRRGGGDLESAEMGKSIRSKRLKRLRTLKRELVTPHYDEKEALKNTVMEAALAAPKVVIPKKRSRDEAMEVEEPARGRSGQTSTSMAVDEAVASTSGNNSKLKARGGIKKRGKSQGRLKKEKHHKKKLNF